MKQKTKFVCTQCGYETPKWLGKCPSCMSWNTFEEQAEVPVSKYDMKQAVPSPSKSVPQRLDEISENEEKRIPTGTEELDRVLGGGIVRGLWCSLAATPE